MQTIHAFYLQFKVPNISRNITQQIKCNAIKKVIAVIMLQVTMKSERMEQMLLNSWHLSASTQFQLKDKKEMTLKKYHLLNKCCVIPPCHLAVNREWWWCCKWQRKWRFEAFGQMLANSLSNISPISFERQWRKYQSDPIVNLRCHMALPYIAANISDTVTINNEKWEL